MSEVSFPDFKLAPTARRMERWGSQSLGLLRAQPAARWRGLIEGVAVVGLSAFAAQLLWTLIGSPESSEALATVGKAVAPAASRSTWRSGALTTFDPFHRAIAATSGGAAAHAPETMLSLQLFGIRVGQGGAGGSAIIAGVDNTQNVYFAGQNIMPGVRLEQVLPGRVTIRRNGVTESLSLDKEKVVAGVSPADMPGVGPATDRSSPAMLSAATEAAEPWRRIDVGAKALFSNLRFTAQTGDTGAAGVVLQSATPTLLEQAGLVSGDVLLAVNGMPVSDIASLTALVPSLGDAERLTLDIERKGQRKVHRIAVDR